MSGRGGHIHAGADGGLCHSRHGDGVQWLDTIEENCFNAKSKSSFLRISILKSSNSVRFDAECCIDSLSGNKHVIAIPTCLLVQRRDIRLYRKG